MRPTSDAISTLESIVVDDVLPTELQLRAQMILNALTSRDFESALDVCRGVLVQPPLDEADPAEVLSRFAIARLFLSSVEKTRMTMFSADVNNCVRALSAEMADIGCPRGSGQSLWLLLVANVVQHNGEPGGEACQRVIQLLEDTLRDCGSILEQRTVAAVHSQLGSLYGQRRNVHAAIEHLETARSIWESLGDNDEVVHVEMELGLWAMLQPSDEDASVAETHLQRALDLCVFGDNVCDQATIYDRLGFYHLYHGDPSKSIEYYLRAIDGFESINMRDEASAAKGNLAQALLRKSESQENLQRALTLLEEAIETMSSERRTDAERGVLANFIFLKGHALERLCDGKRFANLRTAVECLTLARDEFTVLKEKYQARRAEKRLMVAEAALRELKTYGFGS